MKTVIDQLFKDLEEKGFGYVASNKMHYIKGEKLLITHSWRNGRNSGLMGTFTNETEFYNNLISEENEIKS